MKPLNEKRLTDIETKIAYQERLISELNDVLYEQNQSIENLKKMTQLLMNRVMEMGSMLSLSESGDEKPTHY